MTPALVAVLLAGLAGLLGPGARASALDRIAATRPEMARPLGGARPPERLWRRLPKVLAGLAALAAVTSHGTAASVLAVLAVATGYRVARGQRAIERHQARLAADLPRAADLLAGCLDAGAAPSAALAAVAAAVGGPVGSELGRYASVLAAGGEVGVPAATASGPDRLMTAVSRAAATGAPLAAAMRELAADERERARWAATERARVAGVRAVGPLAACFLPAFVLVGVVPVVAGVAGSLLRGAA